MKNLRRPHILGRRSAEMNFPRLRTIESMIVVEKVMTKFYGAEAIKTYVPTIVNIVRQNTDSRIVHYGRVGQWDGCQFTQDRRDN